MKRTLFASLLLAALPLVLSAQSVDDDLYYTPKKSKSKSSQKAASTTTARQTTRSVKVDGNGSVNVVAPNATTIVVRDRSGRTRDVDEYNRRYSSKENTFSVENDTLYIDERADSDLQGEWIEGFEGSADDYEYATRIIRFQNPRYAIPVSSPLYWDIVYARNYVPWDWNIYADGLYAYVFPTFTNSLWWDWRYNSFGWGWSYWHNPVYRHLYWDWGYPYYGWGGGWYGGYHHHPHYAWGAPGPARHWSSSRFNNGGSRPSVASRPMGHDRANRFNSGTRYTGTRVGGSRSDSGIRFESTGNNANATRSGVSGRSSSNGRFQGVQGYRSTASGTGSSNDGRAVRSSAGTRSNSSGVSTGQSRSRSTSSYVRPNSVRTNSNSYTRPSSTRSSSEGRATRSVGTNSSTSRSNSSSYDRGSSVRSSGFFGGSSRSSSGGGHSSSGGGGSRSNGGSGGGHSRR